MLNSVMDEISTGKCTCDYCELNQATHRMYYDVEPTDGDGWCAAGSRRLCKRCLMLYKFKLCSEGFVKECKVTKIL
jgi:hypothetical protein